MDDYGYKLHANTNTEIKLTGREVVNKSGLEANEASVRPPLLSVFVLLEFNLWISHLFPNVVLINHVQNKSTSLDSRDIQYEVTSAESHWLKMPDSLSAGLTARHLVDTRKYVNKSRQAITRLAFRVCTCTRCHEVILQTQM